MLRYHLEVGFANAQGELKESRLIFEHSAEGPMTPAEVLLVCCTMLGVVRQELEETGYTQADILCDPIGGE